MKKLYFDIETEGLPADQLIKLMPEEWPTGNTKDPVKLAAAIEEKKAEWLDKAALKAITGKIVAITTAINDEAPIMRIGDEAELIQQFIDDMMVLIGEGGNAYSWNGSGFDLPFVCQRAAVHNIPAFARLMTKSRGKYYWNDSFIDAKSVWSNYSPDHTGTSLKSVALATGVGEKTGSGKDFAALLKSDPDEAKRYALADITLMRSVISRMGI